MVSPFSVKVLLFVRILKCLYTTYILNKILRKFYVLRRYEHFREAVMKVISTTLKLACSPLSFHDIAWAKNDADLLSAIRKSRVYMVAKKPRIDFCDVKFVGHKIDFDLVSTCGRVSVSIPANEPIFKPSNKKTLVLDVGSKDAHILAKNEVVTKTRGIKFYEIDDAFYKKANDKELKKCLEDDSFVAWLSPEKLLFLYSNKMLRIPNFDKTKNFFWDYEVMYIGKVAHEIALKGHRHHESFLDILESEIDDCEDIRDDIVLLFFDVVERDNSLLIGNATSINEFQVPLNGKNLPSIELLSVEAENVFVDKFKPKYNAVLFHPYVKGVGGVGDLDYDVVDFALNDNINLMFKGMDWHGGANGNCLVYCKNSSLKVMKPTTFDEFLEEKFIESVLSY